MNALRIGRFIDTGNGENRTLQSVRYGCNGGRDERQVLEASLIHS